MEVCTNPAVLKVIYFVLIIIDIIKILVPIALIVLGIIDFSKSVISNDEKTQKNSVNIFIKRLICAVLVFAVPWIVEVVMVAFGNLSDGVNFTDCIENANKGTIEKIENGTYGEACYYCPVTNNYSWGQKPSTSCPGGINWQKQSDITDKYSCKKHSCYYCPVTNKYLWKPGTPSEKCPGGITWEQKNNISKENCK